MNDAYRAALIIAGLFAGLSLASWRMVQLDTAASSSNAPRSHSAGPGETLPHQPTDVHDPPAARPQDLTAELIAAAGRGDVEAVLALVANGGSINAKDAEGITPLLAAIREGKATPELIEKLIKAGADATARDASGRDALTIAAEKDDLEAIASLLKSSRKVARRAAEALTGAAAHNHVEALKALLDNNVDVNARNRDGRTALVSALREGEPDTVKFLLARGADVTRKDAGATPLMLAVARGKREFVQPVVDKLTEQGGNINDRNGHGETALMLAVRLKDADLVHALIDAGSDVNVADSDAATPLMAAAVAGKPDIVQILLDKGADFHPKDSQNETALSLARKNGHDDVVEVLTKAGAVDDPQP